MEWIVYCSFSSIQRIFFCAELVYAYVWLCSEEGMLNATETAVYNSFEYLLVIFSPLSLAPSIISLEIWLSVYYYPQFYKTKLCFSTGAYSNWNHNEFESFSYWRRSRKNGCPNYIVSVSFFNNKQFLIGKNNSVT